MTIMAKVEAAYKAERFTEADQEELVFLIGVARNLLEIYTGQVTCSSAKLLLRVNMYPPQSYYHVIMC